MFKRFLMKYRNVIFALALAVLIALSAGACFFALSLNTAQAQRLTVLLDAGHGGVDGGVTGVKTGVKESDVNLLFCREIQRAFEENGIKVVQTRMSENGLYGAATSGYKRRDMQKRAQIIHDTAPSVVLSVHQNSYPIPTRRGAQVFFREGAEQSKLLAHHLQKALNGMPDRVREFSPLVGDYYILNCSEYPSVIIECGFLTSPEDEALLLSEEYRKRFSKAVVDGVLTFLFSSASGG